MMLKFIIGFERNAGMTRAACHEYLRTVHGPLVRSVPEFAHHVRGYVQNYALPEVPELGAPGFVADGAAELWFDTAESFVTAFAEPRYLELVRPDEARFTNPTRYIATFTRETTLWDEGSAPEFKLMRFLTLQTGVPESGAKALWSGPYAQALRAGAAARPLARRYVQNWSIPSGDNPFPLARHFAGVDEFWFDTVRDAVEFLRSDPKALADSGASKVMNLGESISLLVREGVMPGYR